jgi:heme-degrading monooxygenase HmoA
MTLRVFLEIDVADTDPDTFVAVWRRMADRAARADGNLHQSLNRHATEPSRWFIVSEWASDEDFAAFSASADHAALARDLKAHGRTVAMGRMHEVLAVRPALQEATS